MSKHEGEKCGKLHICNSLKLKSAEKWVFQSSRFQKGHNSYKNWRKKSNAKFQLNMSKRIRGKIGKLCISSILRSKRGITPTKIDGNWQHWNLICSTVKQSQNAKFQLNMSKRVREKCGKLCIFSVLSSKRGITPTKIDGNWRHSNLFCSTVKQNHMQNFSSKCQSMKEKSAENCIFVTVWS